MFHALERVTRFKKETKNVRVCLFKSVSPAFGYRVGFTNFEFDAQRLQNANSPYWNVKTIHCFRRGFSFFVRNTSKNAIRTLSERERYVSTDIADQAERTDQNACVRTYTKRLACVIVNVFGYEYIQYALELRF